MGGDEMGGDDMIDNRQLLLRLACVAVVVCVVFPAGRIVFHEAAAAIGAFPFAAIEAAVTASLGFSLFEVLFG